MPLIRLVSLSTDRNLQILAEQQSADGTMCNHGDVASLMSRKDSPHRIVATALHVDGALPATNAILGFRKERICNSLKFVGRQKTGRSPVIFAKVLVNVNPHTQTSGKNSGRLNRLCLGT